jgi:hypothetical protein
VVSLTPCGRSGILFNLGTRSVFFCAVPSATRARHRRFQPASCRISGHRRKELPFRGDASHELRSPAVVA